MLRQCQRAQQRGALRFAPRTDQAEVKKVRVCNGIFLYGRPLSLKGRARRAERGKQHLGRHPLHAELALLACFALALFLAVHIGNIGVQHAARRDGSLETVADHKARAVGIGEENDAARLGETAQQRRFLAVVEDAEAAQLQNGGVHHLQKRIFVVAALDHDDLLDFRLFHRHALCASCMSSSFSSPSRSMPFSLFMRRSSFWQSARLFAHHSCVVFRAASSSSRAG